MVQQLELFEEEFLDTKKRDFRGTEKRASKKTSKESIPSVIHLDKRRRRKGMRIYKVYAETSGISRDEWLRLRNNGIGGSDIAAILNMSRYSSRRILWLEKTGVKPPDDLSHVEAIHWGNVHEDAVAREFMERTGVQVRKRQAILQRKDKPFMFANVDRLVLGKLEGLECKTAHEYKKGEWSEDSIPDEYFFQCQWYMAVTGFERWHIAALIGGNKFYINTIERDDELIAVMEQEAENFWLNEVKGDQVPAWGGTDDEKEYLASLHDRDEKDKEIELAPELYSGILKHYEEIKKQMTELEKEKKAIENDLKAELKDSERAIIGDHRVKWSGYETSRLDTKRMKDEDPEIYEKYVKKSYVRKFEVK